MLSEYEASVLTRLKVGSRKFRTHRPGPRNRIGANLVALSLLSAAGLLHSAASERDGDLRAKQGVAATRAGAAPSADVAGPRAVVTNPTANGNVKATLFLGYLEFDWNPATPGGVPGFGSWPPSTPVDVAVAGQ